jgi:8-oxo-dGTP diphosphatase
MKYTVVFLFTPDFELVWLITKEKPNWQKGCLNGIGGKIEYNESPIECAIREIKEESGIIVPKNELVEVGLMEGMNDDRSKFQVWVFAGVTTEFLRTEEEEEINIYRVDEIKNFNHIKNVPMLVETCIYRLSEHSFFNKMIMQYDKK